MSKGRFSAEQLCEMYPEKYIAVNHIRKNDENIIIGAEVLKVYDTMNVIQAFGGIALRIFGPEFFEVD